MQMQIDENRIKQILKEALIEALEEKRDVFQALIAGAIEDIALTNAIREGEHTEKVNRQEIFDILEGQV